MSLVLDISTVTRIPREYTGVVIINFPEMEIINRVFTFVANTPEDGPPGAMIFKDSLPFISFEINGDNFIYESEVSFGARTELVSRFFFESIRNGVMSIVKYVRYTQAESLKINFPVSRSVIWEADDQTESLHGVICLACGKEKWLEKK